MLIVEVTASKRYDVFFLETQCTTEASVNSAAFADSESDACWQFGKV